MGKVNVKDGERLFLNFKRNFSELCEWEVVSTYCSIIQIIYIVKILVVYVNQSIDNGLQLLLYFAHSSSLLFLVCEAYQNQLDRHEVISSPHCRQCCSG